MTVRSTVFGSNAERDLFKKLEGRWSDKGFDVFLSLPFALIIDISSFDLSKNVQDFLLKTSVDYTLCCADGKPLLSIDFDGLGKGFSSWGRYIQEEELFIDPNRKWKFDKKLMYFGLCNYPYVIISYEEACEITENIELTIIDGIIGQTIAKLEFKKQIHEKIDENKEYLESLPEWERNEVIQYMVTDLEVDLEFKYDPVYTLAQTLWVEAMDKGLCKGYSHRFVSDPEIPTLGISTNISIEEYISQYRSVKRIGSHFEVDSIYGKISKTCWVNNFEGIGVSPLIISENVGKLLIFNKLLKEYKKSI